MQLKDLYLNRYLYRDNDQNSETKDSSFVSADSSEATPASVPAGGAAQDINQGNVEINGALLEPGTYPLTVLDVSNWGWGQTCAFVSATLNTVTWGAGTFTSADGEAYAISAGTTGVMAAKTYIYLDLNVSETVYQKTTTSSTSVGVGKVLIAVAENAAVTSTYMLSEATQIVGDNLIANTINASKITTGQLVVGDAWVGLGSAEDAAGVTTIVGNTVTTGYVNALSITVIGTLTAGVIDASVVTVSNLTVGTNVGLGTAEDAAGVTTIVGNTITTGYVNALEITAKYVVASVSLSSPAITGGTIAIGSGNAIFKADANGIYLGNATFGSAPFRVAMNGHITATDITITGYVEDGTAAADINANSTTVSGAKLTNSSVTYGKINVTSLSAIAINAGNIRVGGSGNAYGSISVKNISGTEVALMNSNGIIVRQNKAFAAESSSSGVYTQFYTAGLNGIIQITNNASGSFGIKDDDSSDYLMKWTNYDCQSWKSILPGGTTQSLGSSSYKWDDVFCATMKGLYGEIYFDQSGRIEFTNHCDPASSASNYNLGGDSRYWNEVHYQSLKSHSLVFFDEGIELQDGNKVSDIEAIKQIKSSSKMSKYGVPFLDKTSFPKNIYSPAKIATEDIYENKKIIDEKGEKKIEKELVYKKGKKIGTDSVNVTLLNSLFIGAFKELDNRLKTVENELSKIIK